MNKSRSGSLAQRGVAVAVLLIAAWLLFHLVIHIAVFVATILVVVLGIVAVIWALRVLL